MSRARCQPACCAVLTILIAVALLYGGCGGTGGPGETLSVPREIEIEGLGGPPKATPSLLAASSQSDRTDMVAPDLTCRAVRETVPQGAVSWYSFVSQDAPYQVVSCKPLQPFRDVDLYVLGPARRGGRPPSLGMVGKSCRWLAREFGLTDWVAVQQSEAAPGEVCHFAVHDFGRNAEGTPSAIEHAVAELLPKRTVARGTIRRGQEHAWFHFQAQAGRYHRVVLDCGEGDADLYVYAENSAGLLGGSRTAGTEAVHFWSAEPQTIFVRVLSYRAPVRFAVRWTPTTGGGPSDPPPLRTAEQVMLIGWDGVQYNHLNECLARGELPNLQKLIANGRLVRTDIRSHPTDTTSGWAQILTGYGPDINRCFSNHVFRPIPRRLTIFERAKAYYQSQGKDLKTMVVTGKTWPLGSHEGEPYYHSVKAVDTWHGDIDRQADQTGPLMLQCLQQHGASGPFFAFFHFCDPDLYGHVCGENSVQYSDAIARCDRWLGRLIARLGRLNIAHNTRVFVCTDHGFDEGRNVHARAPDAWLVSGLPDVVRDGAQEDVAPTIYAALGIPYETYEPPLAGCSLTGWEHTSAAWAEASRGVPDYRSAQVEAVGRGM